MHSFVSKYQNGDLLRDKVTGLTGVVNVVAFYSTGCIHYGIQAREVTDKHGIPDWVWLDESRMELIEKAVVTFHDPVSSIESSRIRRSGPEPSGPAM